VNASTTTTSKAPSSAPDAAADSSCDPAPAKPADATSTTSAAESKKPTATYQPYPSTKSNTPSPNTTTTSAFPQRHRKTLENLAISAADDSKETTAKLRASLREQLTELDHQEDRLLDLIGDPDWPQDKIKTRLQKVRESKQRITHQLKSTTDNLEPGQAVLLTALELLDRPRDLYDTATDEARKMLNKAIFNRLYLNSTERQPTATAATLSEPFASLVHATRTTDGNKAPQIHTAAEEATTNRLSGLLATALAGQSASKAAMVDLGGIESLT
jgi:hypothetical protein